MLHIKSLVLFFKTQVEEVLKMMEIELGSGWVISTVRTVRNEPFGFYHIPSFNCYHFRRLNRLLSRKAWFHYCVLVILPLWNSWLELLLRPLLRQIEAMQVFNDLTALSEDDLYELRRWATCFLDLYNPENDYDDGAKGRR
ncbi:hypothetical protein P8452_65884 [Trifolium repens]|nr:hypothetical protein P8452_65884 [Trifolium repens]